MQLKLILAALAVSVGALEAPPKAVILMLGDDYAHNNVGFAHGPLGTGNPQMRTRHMDRLASEGIVLDWHYGM